MPYLFSALRVLGRHTVMKSALETLTSLNLAKNRIGDKGVLQLARLSQLEELNLSRNRVGDRSEALSQLANLVKLDLANNHIGEVGAKGVARIASLRSLNLAGNHIGDHGALATGNLDGLSSLNLADNSLSDTGIRKLLEALAESASGQLRFLDLSGNGPLTGLGRETLATKKASVILEASVRARIALNRNQIIEILARGQPEKLCGSTETEQVDFKRSPYGSTEKWQRWELAKDVAALANNAGGLVVIGVICDKPRDEIIEVVVKIRDVLKTKANVQSYRDVVDHWIFPRPEGVEFRWYPQQGPKGILVIDVPKQEPSVQPFVIKGEPGPEYKNSVGIPRRSGTTTHWEDHKFVHLRITGKLAQYP